MRERGREIAMVREIKNRYETRRNISRRDGGRGKERGNVRFGDEGG